MWEFEIMNVYTEEIFLIYGYDYYDACARNDLDPNEYKVLQREYVD